MRPHQPFVPGRPLWWQWLTILSLDAPVVAVLWQWLLARVAGATVGWHHEFILGLSIWLAYAADRWIEGWRLAPAQIRTQRHHFYQRWRWPLCVVWGVALGADVTVSGHWLTRREFAAGSLLLLPVFAYLLSPQFVHRLSRWRAPKEICVALLFGGGVAVFLLAQPGSSPRALAGPLGGFTLLCFANCALIAVWEQAVDQAHGQTSFALQFRRAHLFTHLLPWLLALGAFGVAWNARGPVRTALVCTALSGALLGLLDLVQPSIGPRLARVLADIALMTPLAVWLFEELLFP
jgi:RsiW-degrading membrane proteinase PrsW (M82 family)